jgi:O-antigen ligase
MSNIYSFLNNVWNSILIENKQNKAFVPFMLLLATLPISMAVNNILLGLFFLSSLFYIKKRIIKLSIIFILPILLFLWMVLSYFWTIDIGRTLIAIPRQITLLLIPFVFLLIPPFTKEQNEKIVKHYSYAMLIYVVFFLARAFVRFLITNNTSVFFYHGPDNDTDTGLVPRLLNAIHVSVYVAIAFFYFFIKEKKTKWEQLASFILFVFVILLSSKNITIVFVLLILIQVFLYSKTANRLRLRNLTLMLILLGFIFSFSKIKERFLVEFRTNSDKNISHNIALSKNEGINNVSIADAWTKEQFHQSDYFPGTAFRVYQFRMFIEFLEEESIFWKGFGLNASLNKLLDKEKQYNLYPGYGMLNFHNQYVQNFAELGIVGFVFLVIILFLNTKNAFQSKDFLHITFAVLMISLFLTESFLWRQRGILFFMIFYCLFNSKKITSLEKK